MNYYEYKAISATQVKDYEKNKAIFWKQSVFNPNRVDKKDKDAFIFGRLAHCLFLERDSFEKNYVASLYDNFRTDEAKNWRKKEKRTIIKQEALEKAEKMVSALESNDDVKKLMAGTAREAEFFVKDSNLSFELKCKVDAYKKDGDDLVLIDYKTSSDVDKSIEYNYTDKQKYHLQLVFYEKVLRQVADFKNLKARIILQSKNDNEEDIIAICKYNDDDLDLARSQLNYILGNLDADFREYKQGNINAWNPYPKEVFFDISPYYWNKRQV